MYFIRRALLVITWTAFLLLLWLSYKGHLRIFAPNVSQNDTFTTALYLLTTLVQSLSAILAVTIAVLFIAAQVIARTQYLRALMDIYKDRTTFTTLSIFFIAIILGIISLATIASILGSSNYWILDLNILLSLMAILLLAPLVLSQLENLNPYFLAIKLGKRITIKRIMAYNLALIENDHKTPNYFKYKLNLWGHKYDRDDPLGPVHEIIMEAVQKKDRVELSTMIRVLLQRIAHYSGIYYKMSPRPFTFHLAYTAASATTSVTFKFSRNRQLSGRLAITLHILHYVIRRAHNLRDEWGHFDVLRQQFIANIYDLVEGLASKRDTQQIIDLCLFATMHICLGYIDVRQFGQHEPLRDYFYLADKLATCGKSEQATLCRRIIAFIEVNRARQFTHFTALQAVGSSVQVTEYNSALTSASKEEKWLPYGQIVDPWEYMLQRYKLSRTTAGTRPKRRKSSVIRT